MNSESFSGASPEAIQFHYDTGADFFRLMLGRSMTYTAARFSERHPSTADPEGLADAQFEKIRFHLNGVGCGPGSRLLDIGCGWGTLLRVAVEEFGAASALGLTLSREQFDHIERNRVDNVEVHLKSYEHFTPPGPLDGIVSVGAFEHFAKPELTGGAKIEAYAEFFARCHRWLVSGGRLSLQTIAWGDIGDAEKEQIKVQNFFPESNLPEISEIITASSRYFELQSFENRRRDYEITFLSWLSNLRAHATEAKALVGERRFRFYESCMQGGAKLFQRRKYYLCRFVFSRLKGT